MNRVERADLEAKLTEIKEAVGDSAVSAKQGGLLVGLGVVAVIALAYFWGRRKGRKSSAKVEIYRVA